MRSSLDLKPSWLGHLPPDELKSRAAGYCSYCCRRGMPYEHGGDCDTVHILSPGHAALSVIAQGNILAERFLIGRRLHGGPPLLRHLAVDLSSLDRVEVLEYLSPSQALRASAVQPAQVISPSDEESIRATFAAQTARGVGASVHDSLCPALACFEADGAVFAVVKYAPGATLVPSIQSPFRVLSRFMISHPKHPPASNRTGRPASRPERAFGFA